MKQRTYITPISLQYFVQNPNKLLALADATVVRHLDRQVALLDERGEQHGLKRINGHRMWSI